MSVAFAVFVSSFLGLLIVGVPIAFCMGMASVAYLVLAETGNLSIVYSRMVSALQSYLYVGVAFFILASNLMNVSGVTERIYGFAHSLVGHMRGGLAQVNVLGSIIFSGMSGTALGDAAGLGRIEVRAMTKAGYTPEFAAAVTVASAVIGPIIPPSMVMIIYAELAEVSIAELFMGGVIPGLMIGIMLMVFIYFTAAKDGPIPEPRASWGERLHALRHGFLPLLAPVIIIVGITGGYITTTEAGAAMVVFALLLTVWYREAKLRDVIECLRDAAIGTATPLFIVTTALLFSWIVTVERVPDLMVEVLGSVADNWVLMTLLINVMLLLLGMVLEGIAILILVVPILKPLATQAGIDLVHLGVFMTVNLMIGMITPPVGLSLYVACEIAQRPMGAIVKAVAPLMLPLILALLLVSLVPDTVLLLPRLLLQ